jgi:hypothetical protein
MKVARVFFTVERLVSLEGTEGEVQERVLRVFDQVQDEVTCLSDNEVRTATQYIELNDVYED